MKSATGVGRLASILMFAALAVPAAAQRLPLGIYFTNDDPRGQVVCF